MAGGLGSAAQSRPLRKHLWAQDGEGLLETAEFTFLIKTGLQESGEVMIKHAFFFPKINVPAFQAGPPAVGCWVPFSEFQGSSGQKGLLFPLRLGQVSPRLALLCGCDKEEAPALLS